MATEKPTKVLSAAHARAVAEQARNRRPEPAKASEPPPMPPSPETLAKITEAATAGLNSVRIKGLSAAERTGLRVSPHFFMVMRARPADQKKVPRRPGDPPPTTTVAEEDQEWDVRW